MKLHYTLIAGARSYNLQIQREKGGRNGCPGLAWRTELSALAVTDLHIPSTSIWSRSCPLNLLLRSWS